MIIYGINPVLEALRARRVAEVRVGRRDDPRVAALVALAERMGVIVRRVEPAQLDRATGSKAHQGVVADVAAPRVWSLDDLVHGSAGAALLVVLDGIEDPHNLGAILRTVDAAGASGVVRQSRRAAPLGAVAAKASAGALAHVRVAEVVNIARALEGLRGLGVWTVGLAGDGPARYTDVDFTLPTALVLGAEGTGLRRLVREHCDRMVSIPMGGHVTSLNVSVAAGVVLFEAVRQRTARG